MIDVGGTPVISTGGDGMFGGGGLGYTALLLVIMAMFGFGGNGFNNNRGNVNGDLSVWDIGKSHGEILASINEAKFDTVTELLDTDKIVMGSQYALGTQILETQLGLSSKIDNCCCTIQNTIRDDGDATRSLITNNIIQGLRDRAEAAEFQNSQFSQNQYLASMFSALQRDLQPIPKPSYPTVSPYVGTGNFYGCGGCC